MAENLLEQVIRCVKKQQQRGISVAAVSPENLAVLEQAVSGRGVQRYRQSPPAAAPAVHPAVQRPQAAAKTAAPAAKVSSAVQPQAQSALTACPPSPDVSGAGWDELIGTCRQCNSCPLAGTRRNIVIEDGSRHAPLMFIGEGPGADEDAQGVPFVGAAGQLLTRMINAMHRDRSSEDPAKAVYICNIVKCRPPGNRNPSPEEAGRCLGYLKRQIQLVQPKVIVLLGAVPLQHLLHLTGITRLRGKWHEYEGIPVMPTFHPSYILRLANVQTQYVLAKKQVWTDLQAVMERLKS